MVMSFSCLFVTSADTRWSAVELMSISAAARNYFLDSLLTAEVLAVGDAGYTGAQTGRAARCGPQPDRETDTDPDTGNDALKRSQTVVKQGLTMDP